MATTPRKPAKPRSKTPATRRARPVKTPTQQSDAAADAHDGQQPSMTSADIDKSVSTSVPDTTSETAEPSAAPAIIDAPVRAAPKTRPAPKPRSTNRTTPRPVPKIKPRPASPPVTTDDTAKPSNHWGKAVIAGGIVAVGAAALLSLRSSAMKPAAASDHGNGAHQADSTDASASFEAGIADEGTIPS